MHGRDGYGYKLISRYDCIALGILPENYPMPIPRTQLRSSSRVTARSDTPMVTRERVSG
jgi:hypothetical protein